MGANLWGSSPLQEVRVYELLAKDKVGTARFWLKEVWSKSANSRTETPYKAQPEDEQAQHERSPTDLGQGKWRGHAEEVCASYLGRPARHRLGTNACVVAGAADGNIRRSSGRSQQRP